MALTAKPNVLVPEYLYYFLIHEKLHRIADTSTIPQINNKHIIPYKINLPPLQEQRKIVEILSTWDDMIELMGRQIEAKQRLKKGLMKQLLTGKVRFREFGKQTDEWQKIKLRDKFRLVKRKNRWGATNVLTASGEYGLINQTEYF